jgi:hypothetical protein
MTTTLTAPAGTVPTGVRCGNHPYGTDVRHDDAAAVRACYEGSRAEQAAFEDAAEAERQVERALEDRGYWEAREDEEREAAAGVIPFGEAYATSSPRGGLNAHLDHPSSVVSAKAALIPVSDTDGHAGYGTYAAGGQVIELWEVERPTEGRHAGVTFVRPIGKTYRDNLKGAERARVFLAIAEDPKAAALLYAKSTGKCGVCRRRLWKKESVDRGMGRQCASKFG